LTINKKEYLLKRPIDIILSSAGIIASSPLWTIIAIAIWLEDKGPVFYSQERVGIDGKKFKALKFRTMIPDSDEKFGPMQAVENDPRVTKVGKILRNSAMDELPQLLSILKGDMSFVGPRALLPKELETSNNNNSAEEDINNIPGYKERHVVRPGLTGIAQVYAPRDITRKNKFRYDMVYIKNRSLMLDIKLIFLSFWITFRRKWESRDKKF